MWAIKHFVKKHTKNRQDYFTELLTRISVSMTSLHICKLVSLVTSRNRSRVSFLICKDFTGKASKESAHTHPQSLGNVSIHKLSERLPFNSTRGKVLPSSQVKNHILALQKSHLCKGRLVPLEQLARALQICKGKNITPRSISIWQSSREGSGFEDLYLECNHEFHRTAHIFESGVKDVSVERNTI